MNLSDINFSTNTSKDLFFLWYDYLIFIVVLAFSSLVGIYYANVERKRDTIRHYLFGNQNMGALSIGLSVAVGHFSTTLLMAVPADNYKYGVYGIFACASTILLVVIAVYFYYTVFFNLQITSTYEYLEQRFDSRTRLLASSLYTLSEILFLPTTAYGFSLALATATGFNTRLIIALTCTVCVFYTAIGGLKTVVWTDIFQLLVILVCLTIILVTGTMAAGGISVVWNANVDGRRFEIFDLDLDPTKRDSIWIYLIGMTVHFTSYISISQSTVQKFLALPTFKDCIYAFFYFAAVLIVVHLFCFANSLLLYEKYSDCDPLLSNKIQKHEQMMIYYVMEITESIPGVAGLFVVSLCCAGLSTISSSLNSLSGVIYKDFLSKFFHTNVSEKRILRVLKSIVVIVGAIIICCAIIIDQLTVNLVSITVSFVALAGGPLLGIFTLGVLFPKANAKGAFYSSICAFIFMASIIFPTKINHSDRFLMYPSKPLSISGCEGLNENITERHPYSQTIKNLTITEQNTDKPFFLFHISHLYHTALGTAITVVLGLIVSYATNRNDRPVDRRLISPVSHCFLPRKNEDRTTLALLENN